VAKILGIGGVFFQSNNHKEDAAWYAEKLGMSLDTYGLHTFRWRSDANPDSKHRTEWCHMDKANGYFGDSISNVMINYIVDNLEEMMAELAEKDVEILGSEKSEFGYFAWIMDRAGNRVELWEPPKNDSHT